MLLFSGAPEREILCQMMSTYDSPVYCASAKLSTWHYSIVEGENPQQVCIIVWFGFGIFFLLFLNVNIHFGRKKNLRLLEYIFMAPDCNPFFPAAIARQKISSYCYGFFFIAL